MKLIVTFLICIASLMGSQAAVAAGNPAVGAEQAADSVQAPSLTVYCWHDWDYDLEKSYNGVLLCDIIDNWMKNNTSSFKVALRKPDVVVYNRIAPSGRSLKSLANALRVYLRKGPGSIVSEQTVAPDGSVVITLGHKSGK